jgi:superfamily II DNA/RNA helicase
MTETISALTAGGERPADDFAALGVPPALCSALAGQGIATPFPIQAATIPDAVAGHDIAGQARTGSGKTLAFALPALARCQQAPRVAGHPTALVLTPTRELAEQVAAVSAPLAAAVGVKVALVVGGRDIDKQVKRLERGAAMVVATPGRAIDLVERGALQLGSVELVVVDEADRMADMGFLPQVDWLLRRVPRERQTLVFSATLDGDVGRLARSWMRDPIVHQLEHAREETSITHRFLRVHEMDKARVAAAICNANDRVLVFCNTKRAVDRTVIALRKLGVSVDALHGDLRQQRRSAAVRDFTEGTVHTLVATDVAARGLDIEGVDAVIHYEPATDARTYLHRSGRTGRAGRTGLAVTLMLWNEELQVRSLLRRLKLDHPLPEVFSNDPRLADLAAHSPESLCDRPPPS